MGERRGIGAGYRKLGPVGRFLFRIAVIGFFVGLIALFITIIFGIIQTFTGATKEGQKQAQMDRNIKHNKEMNLLAKIDKNISENDRKKFIDDPWDFEKIPMQGNDGYYMWVIGLKNGGLSAVQFASGEVVRVVSALDLKMDYKSMTDYYNHEGTTIFRKFIKQYK